MRPHHCESLVERFLSATSNKTHSEYHHHHHHRNPIAVASVQSQWCPPQASAPREKDHEISAATTATEFRNHSHSPVIFLVHRDRGDRGPRQHHDSPASSPLVSSSVSSVECLPGGGLVVVGPRRQTINLSMNLSHRLVSLVAVFLLFLSVGFENRQVAAKTVQLNAANFDEITTKSEVVFLNFYADWCRFSQMLAPIFEEASEKVHKDFAETQILFGKVDCEKESTLGTRFHITKYPTLKFLVNGKSMKKEYRGSRTPEAMYDFIKNLLKDPVRSISTSADFSAIEEKKGALMIFSAGPGGSVAVDSKEYQVVRKVATDLRDECNFFWITGDEASAYMTPHRGQAGGDGNLLIAFKPPRTPPRVRDILYPGSQLSYGDLSTWSTDKCIPLVREITFENAEELTEEGLPFLILFHHTDDKRSVEDYTGMVSRELYTESSQVNFLTADGIKFAHPLHHLGKTVKDLPLIAIDSFRHMYLFPNVKEMTVPGKLKAFISDLYTGKLHREFHFGPDPTQENQIDGGGTSPPESTFAKLAPSPNRYTILKDEL